MTEKGKTEEIRAKNSNSSRFVVISDECFREFAEAENPGCEVIGPPEIDWSGPEPVYR